MMALVLFEKDDNILRVSLNRKSVLNAINSEVIRELESGIKEHAENENIKALMLFGQGGCFAAGADIKELAALDEKGIRDFHSLRERTFSLLENFPCPTLAVIEKYALGTGLELALCCDFRIASENSQLGVPSSRLGIVESYEYITRVVRAVGPFQAKKLIVSGERIDAKTAFTIGLIEEITPPDSLFDRADSLIENIANNSNSAMRLSKKAVEVCMKDPNLLQVNDTAELMVDSLKTEDFKEGTKAFLEKRKAKFK
jgi:enoyl-CoA hydratase/carnithine racemase